MDKSLGILASQLITYPEGRSYIYSTSVAAKYSAVVPECPSVPFKILVPSAKML